MTDAMKKYYKDLKKLLEKNNWMLLEPFIVRHKATLGEICVNNFIKASDEVKKKTYIKAVMMSKNVKDSTIKYAISLEYEQKQRR